MKRFIITLVIIGLVGWALYDFLVSDDSASESEFQELSEDIDVGLDKGNLAPDFELETVDGETVQLSDFRGEKILLNFWATWCPPCRSEMPDMQKYHENHEDGTILAVNLVETEQNFAGISEFLDEYGITFNVLLDESSDVANIYEAHALPTSYLIDRNGLIHNKAIGAINYDLLVQQFKEMN